VTSTSEDLEQIEKGIRQLKIEWDKFFGGVERTPPNELRSRIEALLRRYAAGEIRNSTERFRYQTLTARYNTFNELWNKRLRALEEGRPMGLHGRALAIREAELLAMRPARAEEPETLRAPPPRPGEIRVESAELDVQAVRELFGRFIDARQTTGETGVVRFENFQKLITQQTTRILTEKGAQAVDFRLETKDGKVSLKAKAVR
jgi:hypothetical protein